MYKYLFRGKTTEDGTWVYGDLWHGYNGKVFICRGNTREEVNPGTVGGFTQAVDKNDDKIFDGDRIRYTFKTKEGEETFTSAVYFGEYMWLTDEHSLNRCSNREVIGNIHDNV